MADLKTISAWATIPLAVVLVASLFGGVQPNPTHYCESKQIKQYCFSTTATRCYSNPTKTSWNTCSEGWKQIPQPQVVETAQQYLCSVSGCTAIKR
jgi:hypothetical protein